MTGTLLSPFWILAVNSWMQTPADFELIDGRFFPKDWLQIIFNPSLNNRSEAVPFIAAIGLFLLAYFGLFISLWPMIVLFHFTLWEAASSASTQAFLLIGTLFLLPVILMYTGWSYWVFRGKVHAEIGYH